MPQASRQLLLDIAARAIWGRESRMMGSDATIASTMSFIQAIEYDKHNPRPLLTARVYQLAEAVVDGLIEENVIKIG